MQNHIETVINFVAEQMDGATVPPHNSKELNRLSEAVAGIQKAGDNDLQLLALRIVGTVVDRVRSGIGAQATLQAFLTKGGDHAA